MRIVVKRNQDHSSLARNPFDKLYIRAQLQKPTHSLLPYMCHDLLANYHQAMSNPINCAAHSSLPGVPWPISNHGPDPSTTDRSPQRLSCRKAPSQYGGRTCTDPASGVPRCLQSAARCLRIESVVSYRCPGVTGSSAPSFYLASSLRQRLRLEVHARGALPGSVLCLVLLLAQCQRCLRCRMIFF